MSVSEKESIKLKAGGIKYKKTVEMVDDSNHSITVTIWSESFNEKISIESGDFVVKDNNLKDLNKDKFKLYGNNKTKSRFTSNK